MGDVKKQVPVADNIFTWASSNPHLIVTKCNSCGLVMFPRTRTCYNLNCKNKEIAYSQAYCSSPDKGLGTDNH